jgi:hypothetical protein
MEELTSNELHFLVALLASEEAPVQELETDLAQRHVKYDKIQNVLKSLIEDGTVGVTKLENEAFYDFQKDESLLFICNWKLFIQSPCLLFLTDAGYKRWEVHDWGITTIRAQELKFSNGGSNIRVQSNSVT